MNTLRKLHLFAGIFFLVVFAVTGQYMGIFHAGLQGMADGPRMLYRSSHIYLFFAALLNLLLGLYMVVPDENRARMFQVLGSAILLLVPLFTLFSFFAESESVTLSRPLGSVGIYLALLGVALHVLSALSSRKRNS